MRSFGAEAARPSPYHSSARTALCVLALSDAGRATAVGSTETLGIDVAELAVLCVQTLIGILRLMSSRNPLLAKATPET